MKKYLFTLLATIVLLMGSKYIAHAQYQSVYLDDQGRPIRKYDMDVDDIKGTPFLYEKWVFGSVTNGKDSTYKNVRLKYDILNDQLIFAGTNGEMMAFEKPMKRFTLNEMVFANGFPAISSQSTASYYQVVGEGKTVLLKHYTKKVQKTNTYGSAVPGMRFIDGEDWYLYKNGEISLLKPDKKSVLAALNDKASQVNSYLANHKVNFKNDMELGNLLMYYNSL